MKRTMAGLVTIAGVMMTGLLTRAPGASAAEGQKGMVHVDSAKAEFKEVVAGVSKIVLWGDPEKGPYGGFTKFAPGVSNGLHTHTSDLRIVVLKGAYVYKPEKGEEKRVGAGQYLFLPGGDRHVSGSDAKEGALFYEESMGKFDLVMVEPPKK